MLNNPISATRPEVFLHTRFDSSDGREIDPGAPFEDARKGLPRNADGRGRGTDAAITNGVSDVDREPSSDLSDGVGARDIRPAGSEGGGTLALGPGHGSSVLATDALESRARGGYSYNHRRHGAGVETFITDDYHPRKNGHLWSTIGPTVTQAVLDGPWIKNRELASTRLTAVLGFVSWMVEETGATPSAELFRAGHVDRYLSSVQGFSAKTLRTYWHYLLSLCPEPSLFPTPPTGPQPRLIYTRDELVRYRTWADNLPTEARRRRSLTYLALGAGCGLRFHEIIAVTCGDVTRSVHGVHVAVTGRDARTVTVLREWEDLVAALGNGASDQPLAAFHKDWINFEFTRGSKTARVKPTDLPKLDSRPLRAT